MNQRGFGLVQVLITVAIMGIVMTAVATMMTTQMQETRAMTEKLAALDLQKNLSANMANSDVCTFNILKMPSLNFDSSSSNIPDIPMDNTLYMGNSVNSAVLVQKDKAASPISSTVVVEGIWLTNIRCSTSPCVAANNTFSANVEIRLKTGMMVRSIKPPTSEITLTTTGSTSMKTIAGCYGASAPKTITCVTTTGAPYAACPANTTLTGGGCNDQGYNANIKGIMNSYPSGNGWFCNLEICWGSCQSRNGGAYAICCSI